MGAGKSTVGKYLAAELCFPFIDLDSYIEHNHNCTVSSFFEANGEQKFREEELASLQTIIDKYYSSDLVLSLGGGTLTNPLCNSLIATKTKCIYLHCSKEIILKRVKKNESKRPMLARQSGTELYEHISRLMDKREDAYLKASSFRVETSNSNIQEIINEITKLI